MVIVHGSDLQIGRPYRPDVARAFADHARALDPDVVVLSGDLTQRAKAREYQVALEFLATLEPVPVVVTPGNHDVPLFRVWERVLAPHRNWRRFLGHELDTVTRIPGATLVALDSSDPRRAIVSGRLRASQLDFARGAFASAPAEDLRVVVTHHHFVPTPDGLGGRPLPRAGEILAAFEAMGVELVLGGHVHQTHLTTSRALVPGSGPGIPLVACGTTASGRGRGVERGLNGMNVLRITRGEVVVEPHRYDPTGAAFVALPSRSFPRPGSVRGPSGATA